jgi:hypothetical protein
LEITEKGAKPSDLPMDEMFIAARNKVPEAMQKLIDLGADVKRLTKVRTYILIIFIYTVEDLDIFIIIFAR